jgi:hypothetical protein
VRVNHRRRRHPTAPSLLHPDITASDGEGTGWFMMMTCMIAT